MNVYVKTIVCLSAGIDVPRVPKNSSANRKQLKTERFFFFYAWVSLDVYSIF